MLKISSGLLRGVVLRSPTSKSTRPSGERLRQGVFNVLRNATKRWLEEGPVADVFAGTGAWGIEALSNGATEAWFIESNPQTLKVLDTNLKTASSNFTAQKLEVPAIEVLAGDVATVYRRLPVCTVVFCDPPYDLGWFSRILALEGQESKVAPGGLFLYEASAREAVPDQRGGLRLFDSKNYGDSSVHFFVRDA